MVIVQLTTDNRWQFQEYHKPVPWFGPAPEAFLQGFAGLAGTEVHVVSCTQKPMVASPEKLADNMWFHSLHVPKIGWLRTGYQGCIRAVRKKLKEIQPDIVHGQGTERDNAISAVFSGFPNVVTIHGNMAELARISKARIGSFHWLTARLEDFTLPRTAGVLCNSAYTEKLVGSRAKKTWRVPNPLRCEFFSPLNDPTTISRTCILLNVGVISPRKRQLELLDVAQNLWQRGLKFELHFIGLGNQTDAYATTFLERLKPLEAIGFARYFRGFTAGELIQRLDRANGLVHFPSEEAFGLVVAEALARNLKFFGTRLGGILDITESAPGVELFEQNDWTGLTTAIEQWINQGSPRPQGAAILMQARYRPTYVAQRLLEIYREVLNLR